MVIKQAFLGVFHRFMAFCIAMTGATFAANATIPSEYVQIIPDDTTQYPETLTGYTIKMLNNGYFTNALTGDNGNPGYVRKTLSSSNITVSGTGVYTAFVQGVPARTNSVNGINIYAASGGTTYIRLRYIGTDMWGNDVNITTISQANNYFSSNPTPVLYKITTTTNNVHVAAKRISDGVFGYYCTSGDCIATNDNTQVKFIPVYGMTGTVNPCPGGTLQTYTTVAASDVPAGVQNGTPTPTNPIEPVFYQQGKMTLRRIGDYADSYDATTGKITRRIGIRVLNGTEDWETIGIPNKYFRLKVSERPGVDGAGIKISSHFPNISIGQSNTNQGFNYSYSSTVGAPVIYLRYDSLYTATSSENLSLFKQWLATQKSAGTPVTIWYPLQEANYYTEDWAAEQCDMPIKIATRAYNTTQFAPVVSALNTAIDTIKDVVTNTINQTAAVSALQSTKQTRPNEGCPQYRKCMLVEDSSGTPHWYEILDPFYNLFAPILAQDITAGGTITSENPVPSTYTQIEYIESTGSQYVALPPFQNASNIDIITDVQHTDGTNEQIFFAPSNGIQYLYTVSSGWRVWKTGGTSNGGGATSLGDLYARHKFLIKTTSAGVEYYVDGSKINVQPSFTSSEFSGKSLNIGARTTSSGADFFWKGKIYSFKAICDGVVCMDLVPVRRNSDQSVGMYDTVTGSFTGTGTFGDGNAVSNQTASWSVTFTGNETGNNIVAGTVSGTAKCNALSANENTVATSAQLNNASWTEPGNNCWCVATLVDITNSVIANGDNWVLSSTNQNCDTTCANECATKTASGASTNTAFRHAIAGF